MDQATHKLHGKLREHGIADVSEVAAAYMERDGEISVLKQDCGGDAETGRRRRKRA